MKKRARSKKKINFYHAKRRMRERYGTPSNKKSFKKIYKSLVRRIQNSFEDTLVERQNENRSIHHIVYDGIDFFVVYDDRQSNIVTALPPRKSSEA